jgi:hypothetical protein
MEASSLTNNTVKQNWFKRTIKKYPIIDFTIGFLLLGQLILALGTFFGSKEVYQKLIGINIWIWIILLSLLYFLQWLLVVWIASKLPKEKLQHKFLKHPIATIIFSILYIISLPDRFTGFNGNVTNAFENVIYYAMVSFLWWLLICWISDKIFKKEKSPWVWYQKMIEKIFAFASIIYKIILGLVVVCMLFPLLFILITGVFKYSGKDLNTLFNY